jgi:hypothetical protein
VYGQLRGFRKSRASNHRNENERVLKSKESPLDNALNFFVPDGALKPVERDEIVKLIDYRNHIAHRIEYLMADIGRSSIAEEYARFRQRTIHNTIMMQSGVCNFTRGFSRNGLDRDIQWSCLSLGFTLKRQKRHLDKN